MPTQLFAVHQGAGVGAAAETGAFGDELHADGFHLLFEVEVLEVLHAGGVEHIAEVAQILDVDDLALVHAGAHHACNVAQHGLNVGVTHCGDFCQILGNGLRFHGFALHYRAGVVNRLFLIKHLFPKWHNSDWFKC